LKARLADEAERKRLEDLAEAARLAKEREAQRLLRELHDPVKCPNCIAIVLIKKQKLDLNDKL
jgi:signal transduction histidine kinase